MNKMKFLLSLILAVSILIVQTGGVFAASTLQDFPPMIGVVQSITVETDSVTGVTTVLITVMHDNQVFQTVRVSQKTAEKLGLVVPDNDGKPLINKSALGLAIEIKPNTIIPHEEQERHPVGDALATFFSDSLNVDHNLLYETIMAVHEGGFESGNGFGFGVIAQALWLTQQIPDGDLEGEIDNLEVFKALLVAKETGIYTNLPIVIFDENGATITPKNWGELKKAILDGNKISNLGSLMSTKNDGNGNTPEKNKEKNKVKEKDKGGKDKEKEK